MARAKVHGAKVHGQSVGSQVAVRALHLTRCVKPGSARVEPYRLPDEVAAGLIRLMRTLGISYGAIDMRVTLDGEHVFLEVNPAGEYLFIHDRTGQLIPQAIADCLERHAAAYQKQLAG